MNTSDGLESLQAIGFYMGRIVLHNLSKILGV